MRTACRLGVEVWSSAFKLHCVGQAKALNSKRAYVPESARFSLYSISCRELAIRNLLHHPRGVSFPGWDRDSIIQSSEEGLMSKEAAGTIVSLWHYPVKSMQGEELNAADLSERGVAGDRAYALVDASNGKVGSAKNPRKWPGIFDCRARFADSPRPGQQLPPVRMILPDGRLVTNNAPE